MFFKQKPREVSALTFDCTYQARCPICMEEINETEHLYESNFPPLENRKLLECGRCHLAVWGTQINIKKTFIKYVEDNKDPFGLREIERREI